MASPAHNALSTVPSDVRIIQTNEKVTGPPAVEMIRRCKIEGFGKPEPLEIMDNACGGGVVTSELLRWAKAQPDEIRISRIITSDIDEGIISCAQQRKEDSHWSNVEVMTIDQTSVPLPDNTFSHVFNNFGIFFHPKDETTLSETLRVLKPGAVAGFTSWKSIGWVPTLARPALAQFIPEAPTLPDPVTIFPAPDWNEPTAISNKLKKAGFEDVQVSEYRFTPNVEAEEFAEATAVLIKVMAMRFWSKEENERFDGEVEPAFLRYLRENYPEGKWNGEMVALIATGRKR